MTTIKEVFNEIAPSWYNYRHWTIFRKELETLAERWESGLLLNVGCGHGPDFLPFAEKFELYGVDIAPEMLKMAEKYANKFNFEVKLTPADAVKLPYDDNYFDYAIAVASYHHIKGRNNQLKALEELHRVLKVNGEAFITVWNRRQKRFRFSGKETMVPWRTKSGVLERYYHLFTYGEFTRLAKQAGFTVVKAYPEAGYHGWLKYFSRNICLEVRKD